MNEIKFKLEEIAFLVSWSDEISMESDGSTAIRNIEDLKNYESWKKPYYRGLISHSPEIKVFENSNKFFKEESIMQLERFKRPICRNLSEEEQELAYKNIMKKAIGTYSLSEQKEWIHPMFSKNRDFMSYP